MFSIENFYWILHQNLLKPLEIDCHYYYPFGTMQNLSRYEWQVWKPRETQHVLFHFDQEPLWTDSLGNLYDVFHYVWSPKYFKALANSEQSLIKKQLCHDRQMHDWYFFYHGFASLDWFRDSQYLGEQDSVVNHFISLNHLISHKRSYRMALTARLITLGVIDQGTVSFHGSAEDCQQEIISPYTNLSQSSRKLISKTLCTNKNLPRIVDFNDISGAASAHFGFYEYRLWQKSFLHLVNETVFYDQKLHLTEKTFKPIVSQRPFVLVAAPNNLQYLRNYGFQTFGDWWDESYDSIEDNDQRLDAIAKIIQDLCRRPMNQIREILQDMQSVLNHNKQHFFGEFRQFIVEELVDNFETCLKIWNNGRIDNRELRVKSQDLESVKQILMR
jgi:hypothetical protein